MDEEQKNSAAPMMMPTEESKEAKKKGKGKAKQRRSMKPKLKIKKATTSKSNHQFIDADEKENIVSNNILNVEENNTPFRIVAPETEATNIGGMLGAFIIEAPEPPAQRKRAPCYGWISESESEDEY